MAENVDFEIIAGVLPDIASAQKAGAQLRAVIEAEIAKVTGRKSAYAGVREAAGGFSGTTGYQTYSQLSEIERAMYFTNTSKLDGIGKQRHREALDKIKTYKNVAKRVTVNEPINEALSYSRQKRSAERALETLGQGLDAGFRKEYMRTALWGNQKDFDVLDASLDQKKQAASTIINFAKKHPGQQVIDDEQMSVAKSVMRLDSTMKKNIAATTSLTRSFVTLAAGAAFETAARVVPTYWQEQVDRSFWGNERASIERTKAYGRGIGTVVGGGLGIWGGAAAGAAMGAGAAGIGAIPGAIIGGIAGGLGLGAVGGTVGEMYGVKSEKDLESILKTISFVQDRYRANAIYGSQLSLGYADMVGDTGMASKEDVTKMVHNSSTLAARMMFGQVGAEEMMYYSMMPNYFAAAMRGAPDDVLANEFAKDMGNTPDVFKTFLAERVGGGSLGMLAYTQSPIFKGVQSNAWEARAIDQEYLTNGAAFMAGSVNRAVTNRRIESGAFSNDLDKWASKDSFTEDETNIYDPRAEKYVTEHPVMGYIMDSLGKIEAYQYGGRDKKIPLVVNINLDGDTLKSYSHEITDEEINSGGYTSTVSLE